MSISLRNGLVVKKVGNITSAIWDLCEFGRSVEQVYLKYNSAFDLPHPLVGNDVICHPGTSFGSNKLAHLLWWLTCSEVYSQCFRFNIQICLCWLIYSTYSYTCVVEKITSSWRVGISSWGWDFSLAFPGWSLGITSCNLESNAALDVIFSSAVPNDKKSLVGRNDWCGGISYRERHSPLVLCRERRVLYNIYK